MEFENDFDGIPTLDPGLTEFPYGSRRPPRRTRNLGEFDQAEGLSEIARYGGYAVYDPPGNTDPYIGEALKSYSYDMYDELRGKTRRGAGVAGEYKSLYKYRGDVLRWRDLTPEDKRCMRLAYDQTRKDFDLGGKVEPLDWHEAGPHLRRDTAAGVTWPGKTKGEVIDEIYPAARWLGHRMKHGGKGKFNPTQIKFPPCLAAKRGHMSDISEPKTRLVWMYPAEMLVVEGLYAPVWYERIKNKRGSPMLFGSTPTRMYSEWVSQLKEGQTMFGTDFSAFDTTIPPFLIRMAFQIIHDSIDFESWKGKPVSHRNRQKWRNVWDGMVWYFINTPILMPDGRLWRKYRGVPSGSWWTMGVNSILDDLLIRFAAIRQQSTIDSFKCLGDDGNFMSYDFDTTVARHDLWRVARMTLSVEKTGVSVNPCEFKLLGTKYKGGKPHRETKEWFELALYPEHPPGSLQMSLTRLVGIWLAGAMYDMKYCTFMEYFQKGYPCPTWGRFSRDQRRWMTVVHGKDFGEYWVSSRNLQARAFTYNT